LDRRIQTSQRGQRRWENRKKHRTGSSLSDAEYGKRGRGEARGKPPPKETGFKTSGTNWEKKNDLTAAGVCWGYSRVEFVAGANTRCRRNRRGRKGKGTLGGEGHQESSERGRRFKSIRGSENSERFEFHLQRGRKKGTEETKGGVEDGEEKGGGQMETDNPKSRRNRGWIGGNGWRNT